MYPKLFLKNNYFCIKFIKVWLTEGEARNSEKLSTEDSWSSVVSERHWSLRTWRRTHVSQLQISTQLQSFAQSCKGRWSLDCRFWRNCHQKVDSGFWWIILLHAYTRATGDYSLSHRLECQNGMKLILSVCLVEGFGTFPTLLCADGCCVTDRRMVSTHWKRFKVFFPF